MLAQALPHARRAFRLKRTRGGADSAETRGSHRYHVLRSWRGGQHADDGEVLPNSRPALVAVATSSLGESAVTKGMVVDRYAPRLYEPVRVRASRGALAQYTSGTKV